MSNWRAEVMAPVFPVADVRQSIRVYIEQLGFTLSFEWSDTDGGAPTYGILRLGGIELHLSEASRRAPAVAYVFIDNIEACHAGLQENGANITEPIRTFPWQMREFEVTDPDGNRLIFGEHTSRISARQGNG